MKWWILALAITSAACQRPLAPGETRCTTTTDILGTHTKCKTGQAPPPPVGWWCSTSTLDPLLGGCRRGAGDCEVMRAKMNDLVCKQSACDAHAAPFTACVRSTTAICAATGCFTTPATCADFERRAGRDGAACRAVE